MATRFWVGGTGTWDAVTTTHWAATTGAAGGASVPSSADSVTFDGASGGGVVTVNFGGTITVQSIACGAFTGTLDFSANNNSVTLSAAAGFNGSGAGTRTINLGNGTWTIAGVSGTPWNMATTTGLTFNANSSTINLTATAATPRTFAGGGLTYNSVSVAANSSGGNAILSGANTFSSLTLTGLAYLSIPISATQTIGTLSLNGSSGSEIGIITNLIGTQGTISVVSNAPAMTWVAFRDIAFTGGATFTATNSFNLGNNTGITITAPSTGGGLSPAPIVIARGTPY